MKTLSPLQPGVFYHIYNRGLMAKICFGRKEIICTFLNCMKNISRLLQILMHIAY